LSFGDFLAKTLNFLAFIYLARKLGVEPFGILEYANSLLTWFLLVGDGGLELWATREAAQARDLRALAGRVLPLRAGMAAAGFLALLASLPFLPAFENLTALMILFGLSIFVQAGTLKWVWMGREKMTRVAAGLVAGQIIFALAVFLLVRGPENVLVIPLIKLGSDLATAAYFAARFGQEHSGLGLPYTLRGAGTLLRAALTLGASQAMGLLNYNFDTLLLGFLKGADVVGWYNAAYKPVTMALAAPLTYFQGLFPALARAWTEERDTYLPLVERSFRLCAIAAVPLGVGGTLLARPIIRLLFGAEYSASVLPFRILVWSAVFVILRGSYRHALNAAGQQRLDLRCAVASATTNVGLNILLIPGFGMAGSASATVAADVLWFVLATSCFHRAVMPCNPLRWMARPLAAGAVMAALLLLLPWHWIVRAAIAVPAYVAVLAGLGEPEIKGWLKSQPHA